MKQSERKRLQILEAAQQLFAQHGAQNTSMDLIAKHAEVSKRTIYNHFETKELLLYNVLEHMMLQVDQGDIYQYRPDVSIAKQLQEIALREVNLLTSESFIKVARVAFIELLQDPTLAAHFNSSKVGCMRYLETFLADAVTNNALYIEHQAFAAQQFLYQLKSFIFYPRLYGFDLTNTEETDFIVEQSIALFMARYGTQQRSED
ncbi:TetR/AcrR family transcriptional regulator [Pseudoalteromonas sp. S2755]|uniref:TetR/AcrR family transcriptional regulator n=1 Tax=Pseudoalteromonas sp. S2755 TaxID=2066523 RepID=UPI00110BB56E|nr:TetR/AcrR family transcriptional regulator [Pseudoalteromonas sp. S2755]TMN33685.1 TetR family transcriptional regulator [Pseudoalteromonas sp. S2755]